MKICKRCKLEKPIEEFDIWNPSTGERRLWCKSCAAEDRAKRHAKNAGNKHVVYGLFDPRTNQCRYVGKTARQRTRLSQHMTDARRYDPRYSYKHDWILEVLNAGLKPEMRVLEECSAETISDREAYWIERMIAEGAKLVNSFGYSQKELAKRLKEGKRDA